MISEQHDGAEIGPPILEGAWLEPPKIIERDRIELVFPEKWQSVFFSNS